jgi:hypothetical protein
MRTLLIAVPVLFLSCDRMQVSDMGEDRGKGEVSVDGINLTDSMGNRTEMNLALSKVDLCTRDKKSGLIKIQISSEKSAGFVAITLKSSKSEAESYACEQSRDNRTTASKLGDMFDTCMVELGLPNVNDKKSLDTYSMCRTKTAYPMFDYDGDCSVKILSVSPNIEGRFSCDKLVQVTSRGNPVREQTPDTERDIEGSFSCKTVLM